MRTDHRNKKKMPERVSDQEVRGEIGPDVNLAYNYHEQQTRWPFLVEIDSY